MNAADVMTRNVVTVRPKDTVQDAVKLMMETRISGLPVVDEAGAVVGLLSEADLMRRAELGTGRTRSALSAFIRGEGQLAADYVESHAVLVEDVMRAEVLSVAPGTELSEIVDLMEKKAVKRVPVVEAGRLVGIVTRADLVRALSRHAGADVAQSDDQAIRDAILSEIARQPWAPGIGLSVIVQDGVAHLCGTVFTATLPEALRVLAEGVPGVKAVKDHITFVEPVSGAFVDPVDGPAPENLSAPTPLLH